MHPALMIVALVFAISITSTAIRQILAIITAGLNFIHKAGSGNLAECTRPNLTDGLVKLLDASHRLLTAIAIIGWILTGIFLIWHNELLRMLIPIVCYCLAGLFVLATAAIYRCLKSQDSL